jgi:hypothetical protein
VNACVIPKDREEVFMPIEKSKPAQSPKPGKDKKSSELRDDELRSVSGGLASTGGVKATDPGGCVSQT